MNLFELFDPFLQLMHDNNSLLDNTINFVTSLYLQPLPQVEPSQDRLTRIKSITSNPGDMSRWTINLPATQSDVNYEVSPLELKIQRSNKEGFLTFNAAFDSYLQKHPEDASCRPILTKIAALESGYLQFAKNPKSSASGYFLFIDSTRKTFCNKSKEEFLSNPELLIESAVKLYKHIYNKSIQSKLNLINARGLSVALAMYGYWFNPSAMNHYLNTGTSNFKDPQGTTLLRILSKMAK